MSFIRKLAGETAIYGLSSILGRVINYALVPFYTRIFPRSEYGIISDLYAWAALLMVVYVFRMETAFFRFYHKKEVGERAFTTAWGGVALEVFLLSLLMFGLAPQIAAWLHYPGKAVFVRVFAAILALDALSEIPFAKLRADGRPVRFAAIRLTNIFVNVGANLFFLLLLPWVLRHYEAGSLHRMAAAIYRPEWGILYVFLSNLLASAVSLLLLLPVLFRVRWSFEPRLWKHMLWYAAPLVLAGLAGIVNEVIDRTLLKTLLPGSLQSNLAQVGIYSANYKIATLLSLFTQAYRYAAEPFFFAKAKEKNAPDTYARSTYYFLLAAGVGVVLIGSWLDVIIRLLGKGYREGMGIVPIILLANLFLGVFYNMAIWYKVRDRTYVGAVIGVTGALITLAFNYWLIPRIGYYGSAVATLACYFAMMVIVYRWGQRVYPIPYPVGRMAGFILLVTFVTGANYFLTVQPAISRPLSVLIRLILTTVVLFFVWQVFSLARKRA